MLKKNPLPDQEILETIFQRIEAGICSTNDLERPFVSLTFAQSLDGSISLFPHSPVKISNSESLVFTHHLRSAHDAILVGIGTLIADDPLLSVRLVDGKAPQPIIVDSKLRFPLNAKILRSSPKKPWIASTNKADAATQKLLEREDAKIFHLPAMRNGWVNLPDLLSFLHEIGIRSLMVEGGARIISSFLRHQLADQLILTISPMILGGFRAVHELKPVEGDPMNCLHHVHYHPSGSDLLVRGDLIWK